MDINANACRQTVESSMWVKRSSMNVGVNDIRGFWFLLTSPKRLVIEFHYVVIPAYIEVNRVTRLLKWNIGRYAGGESVRIGWRCEWGEFNPRYLFLWSQCILWSQLHPLVSLYLRNKVPFCTWVLYWVGQNATRDLTTLNKIPS
jgi:hypothetical protein